VDNSEYDKERDAASFSELFSGKRGGGGVFLAVLERGRDGAEAICTPIRGVQGWYFDKGSILRETKTVVFSGKGRVLSREFKGGKAFGSHIRREGRKSKIPSKEGEKTGFDGGL